MRFNPCLIDVCVRVTELTIRRGFYGKVSFSSYQRGSNHLKMLSSDLEFNPYTIELFYLSLRYAFIMGLVGDDYLLTKFETLQSFNWNPKSII